MTQNKKFRCLMLISVLATCKPGHITAASGRIMEPLPVEATIETRSFVEDSAFVFSPDGEWIAYVVHEDAPFRNSDERSMPAGHSARIEGSEIRIVNRETGETQSITRHAKSSWDPTWSPNGHYLAYLSDVKGKGETKLWVWDVQKRSSRMLSDALIKNAYPMNRMLWMPDSTSILSTTIGEATIPAPALPATLPATSSVTTLETLRDPTVTVYKAGGGEHSAANSPAAPMFDLDTVYLRDLSVIDVATGRATILVRGKRIGWYALSPDGSRVAFVVPKRFDRPGSYQKMYDLGIVSLATKRVDMLATDLLLDDTVSWSPDSRLIAFGEYKGQSGYEYCVMHAVGGAIQTIAELPYHSYSGGFRWMPLWDSTSEYFYFLLDGSLWRASISERKAIEFSRIPDHSILQRISASMGQLWTIDSGKATVVITHDNERRVDGFYKIDLGTGDSSVLLEDNACYTCKLSSDVDSYDVAVSNDGKYVAFTTQDAAHPPTLVVSDSTLQNLRKLSDLNPQFAQYEMGSVRLISWLSDDGDRLHGALLLPPDQLSGAKCPLIVWVYPGELLSNYFDRFGLGEFPGPLNLQLFATRGYAVFLPDSPAKTVDRISDLAKSVLPGVNRVIEMGIADPERIGIIGHSQGGFATMALIVRTARFKAAVALDGWGDYVSYYGLMQKDGSGYQYGQAERQLGGPPWVYPMRYVESSPLFYLDRVRTPLLIVHGSQDSGHPAFLADEVFVGLRRLGKTVEYAKYEGEGHSPRDWSFANQRDLALRVIAWFGAHLNGPAS